MTISADLVKELREETGAGVLACREALEETSGNMQEAITLLKEQGLAAASKRAGRETRNGVLDLYNHGDGRVGVMVEVNCETDFVARTEEFRAFTHEIALQIAANSPSWVSAKDVPEEVLEQERAKAREMAEAEGKPEKVIPRIVEGRLDKFLDEHCLLRQAYIREDTKMVEEVLKEMIVSTGENISIRRFERWTVGEEIAG
jgi:elongation factor Ts